MISVPFLKDFIKRNLGQDWQIAGPVAVTNNSYVYKGKREGDGLDLAIKISRTDAGDLRNQYSSLVRVAAGWQEAEGLTIQRIEFFSEDPQILVTNWLSGVGLDRRLRRPWRKFPETIKACRQAGKWLRHCHAATGLQMGRVDVKTILKFAKLEANKKILNHPVGKSALKTLEMSEGFISTYEVETAFIHGDFKPSNVLILDRSIAGIDINCEERNVVILDISHFLNHVLLNTIGRKHAEACSEVFMSGYGKDLSSPALSWIRISGLLRMWSLNADFPQALICHHQNRKIIAALEKLSSDVAGRI